MSMKATRLRSRAAATTSFHCSAVRSAPVGLWQQACSTTMAPAGSPRRQDFMAAKLRSELTGGRHHFLPLFGREVGAGGVVAAGVQHDDGASRQPPQAGLHGGEVETPRCRVVVRVVLDCEAGG